MTRMRRQAFYDLGLGLVTSVVGATWAYAGWPWLAFIGAFPGGGLLIYSLTEFRHDEAVKAGRLKLDEGPKEAK